VRSPSRFRAQIDGTRREFISLWHATPATVPALGDNPGFLRRCSNARAARQLIDDLASDVRRMPDGEPERLVWREQVRERLQRFGEDRLGWPAGYRRLVFAEDFFAVSRRFAREARRFAPELPLADLWQALRNVWIGNSIQMLLDLPVRLGPALGAYSLLYPYTDNYLDDPAVGAPAKLDFNRRLGRRLAGHDEAAVDPRQQAVFRLVRQIEDAWPRRRFPEVHWSLLAIHAGQVRSLRQQRGGVEPAGSAEPGERGLLSTSCAKGGASVLADGYLVAGSLDPGAAEFCFGYGVFLQLLDDLQDALADRRAGQRTLFSRQAGEAPLDALTSRLYRLIDGVLEGGRFAGPRSADRLDLVRRNCVSLLVGAVAESPRLFTRGFVGHLESRWPLRFADLRRLRARARRRYEGALRTLRRRRRVDSLLDLLAA
jgi:hypothetical protein